MSSIDDPGVPEISWFSALCDDDYEFLGVPDPSLASSWPHCSDIVRTAAKTGADVTGPIPLPVKIERWTVLRSPHVDKKSREQFELRTHKRLLDINDSRPQTMDALTKLDLPAGVDVEIKVR